MKDVCHSGKGLHDKQVFRLLRYSRDMKPFLMGKSNTNAVRNQDIQFHRQPLMKGRKKYAGGGGGGQLSLLGRIK